MQETGSWPHRCQHSLVAWCPTTYGSTSPHKQDERTMNCGVLLCPNLGSMFRGLHEGLRRQANISAPNGIVPRHDNTGSLPYRDRNVIIGVSGMNQDN